jgi:hypothetical protein
MKMNSTLARRTLIDIARRRQKPGAGSTREFLLARTAHMIWPDLSEVFDDLSWAVVGAVATRLYMPERMTRDMDVVIAAADSINAQAKLQAAGWKNQGPLTTGGASWLAPDGTAVDVLEGHEEWWPQALLEAQSNHDAQGLPILPLPYLVLMKFQAGRVNDIADITRMVGQADETALDKTRQLFQQCEPEGQEDLESLIVLGRLELGS